MCIRDSIFSNTPQTADFNSRGAVQYVGTGFQGRITGIEMEVYETNNIGASFRIFLCSNKQVNMVFFSDLINCDMEYFITYGTNYGSLGNTPSLPVIRDLGETQFIKRIDFGLKSSYSGLFNNLDLVDLSNENSIRAKCLNLGDVDRDCSINGFNVLSGDHVYVQFFGITHPNATTFSLFTADDVDNFPGDCLTGRYRTGSLSTPCGGVMYPEGTDLSFRLIGDIEAPLPPLPDLIPFDSQVKNTYIVPGSYSPSLNHETATTSINFSFDWVLGSEDYENYNQYPVLVYSNGLSDTQIHIKSKGLNDVVDYNLLRPYFSGPLHDNSFPNLAQTFNATVTVPYLGATSSVTGISWYPAILNIPKARYLTQEDLSDDFREFLETGIVGNYHYIFWEGSINYTNDPVYGPQQFFATSSSEIVYECDPDSNFWSRSICLLLVKITQPSEESIRFVNSGADELRERAPFVHVLQITSMLETMLSHSSTTASSTVAINLPMIGSFEVASRQDFEDLPYADIMKSWVAYLICFMTAFQVYRRGKSLFSNIPLTV